MNSLEVYLILRIPLDYEGIHIERMPLTILELLQFRKTGIADVLYAGHL